MRTVYDQLDARIDQFGNVPWPAEKSYREHETERADLYSAALFHLLGMLTEMTSPNSPAPTKTAIARAVTVSLNYAQPDPATAAA